MHPSAFRLALFLLLPAGLVACNKPTTDAETAVSVAADEAVGSAPDAATPPAAAPATGAQGLLKASIGAATCEAGSDVRFDWDVTSKPGIASVEVWVGEGENAKLFTAGGPQGGESTGPWVKPATVFVLRDKGTQEELDRIVIGGPACAADPAMAAEPA